MAKPVRHRGKWRIRWFDENGVRQSEVCDDYRVAQAKLREHEVEVEQIRRGTRDAPPAEHTFGELCDYWIEKRAPQKRSGDDDKSIIKVHLRPAFGALPLKTFAARATELIDSYKVERAHLSKQTVKNHLTLLGTMLTLAVDLGWLRQRPKIEKPRVRLFGEDYRWLRTDDEIARFLRAARDDDDLTFALYATAVYTGMRAGELAGLRWDDVDFDRRLITVQRSFAGPTKAGDVRHVPILDPLLPILRAWRLRCPIALVFPNAVGEMHDPSARIFQERLHVVLRAAGLPDSVRAGKTRPYIRFHDLRHTFASQWVLKGGDLFKLQKILGHKSVQMTMRYAHLQPAAFREDYGRFGGAPAIDGADVIEIGSVAT
jgi:integrase